MSSVMVLGAFMAPSIHPSGIFRAKRGFLPQAAAGEAANLPPGKEGCSALTILKQM
jgi:hypothetical protein